MNSHDFTCHDSLCQGDESHDCPGRGRCHGCMAWCDRCGDVDDVCDYHECMVHRCYVCHNMLTYGEREMNYELLNEWHRWCFGCYAKQFVQPVIDRDENEMWALEAASRRIAPYVALDAARK